MLYLVALLLPPLALLLISRPALALLCLVLQITLIGWPIAAIWAVVLVANHNADSRSRDVLRALGEDIPHRSSLKGSDAGRAVGIALLLALIVLILTIR